MGISLGIILGMIWMAAKFVRRRGVPGAGDSTALEVVGRRSVGRRSNLIVVKAGERTLLVGCTENQVSLVADLTPGADPVQAAAATPGIVLSEQAGDEADRIELSLLDRAEPGARSARPVAGAPASRATLIDSIRDLTVRRV
jgi:flagellar biosynthetic protein FliO